MIFAKVFQFLACSSCPWNFFWSLQNYNHKLPAFELGQLPDAGGGDNYSSIQSDWVWHNLHWTFLALLFGFCLSVYQDQLKTIDNWSVLHFQTALNFSVHQTSFQKKINWMGGFWSTSFRKCKNEIQVWLTPQIHY